MPYANNSDVEVRMRRFTINGTSAVTDSDVGLILEQVSAEINGALAQAGLTVPTTEPEWLMTRLKALEADGAAAIVLKSLFPESTGAGESPAYAFYDRRYRDGLKMLAEGSLTADVVAGQSNNLPVASTYLTKFPDEEATMGIISGGSIFRVGQQF